MKKKIFALFNFFILFHLSKGGAIVHPEIQWESISTPHFEVLYDAKHYLTARKYALRLELNHKLLMSYFQESPSKTVVILNDSTDLANGYATYVPYAHIMLYPVLPTSLDSISEYSDWPRDLTLHEYTHILNFEPAHGVIRGLRYLMGSVITPTTLLPRWWHEGIAVEMETRFSSHGRLRSIYQDSTLRALVRANQLDQYSIADVNESTLDSWPRGARPYLFGSLLLSEILASKEGPVGNHILQSYSRRIPYLINGPVMDETNSDFESWFQETKTQIKSNSEKQLSEIRTIKPSNFTTLAPEYLESHSPQLSPNGRFLSFIAKNRWGKSSIQIFDRHEDGRNFDLKKDSFSEFLSVENKESSGAKDSPPSGNINRVAWMPDSSGFIFDQVRFVNSYSNFSDLFYFDLNLKKTKRLTTGSRLREPCISDNGLIVASVQLVQSDTQLVALNADGSNLRILYAPPSFHKISSPIFLENESLLFIEQDREGTHSIKKMELSSQSIHTLSTGNLTQISALSRESSGITFVGQEGGLQNFYITTDVFKTYKRLSHTETAVFNGAIDARMGNLYNTLMTEVGPAVTTSEYKPEGYPSINTPISSNIRNRYPGESGKIPSEDALEKEFGPLIEEKKEYSSLKYLIPQYWLPFLFVTDTGYGTQISTSAFDPLEKHSYSIQAGYDSFARESRLGFNYTNATTQWPITFGYASQVRDQALVNSHYASQQMNLLATHNLFDLNEDLTVGVGLDATTVTMLTTRKRLGPQFALIFDGAAKSNYSAIPYSGLQGFLLGNHYPKTDEFSLMTRSLANLTYFHSRYLPSGHIALLQLMGQELQGDLSIGDYSMSEASYLSQDFKSSRFVLRGYEQGYFYFKSSKGITFEYQIPLLGYSGWGTLPIFAKRSRLNLFAQTLSFEGFALNHNTQKYSRTHYPKHYRSYGLELKGDFTVGYYLPTTFVFGLYFRPDFSGPNKASTFLGIQI